MIYFHATARGSYLMVRSLGQSFLDWCSRYSTWGLAVGVLVLIVLHTTGFGGFQIDFVTVGLLALLFLIPQFGDLERLAVGNLEATFNQEQVNESFAKQGQAALSEAERSTKNEETDDSPAVDSTGASHTELSADARASLTFPPQRSAGQAVVLEEVYLSHPGFVAVHDDSLLEGETFAIVAFETLRNRLRRFCRSSGCTRSPTDRVSGFFQTLL
jgi:hypothetical protein